MRYALLAAIIFLPCRAIAEETVDCSSSCPDGQVMVSYADGNNSTCLCAPAAQMDQTVPQTVEAPQPGDG